MALYGGMKGKELRSLVKSILRNGEGSDYFLNDESRAPEIINDLLDEIRRLRAELKKFKDDEPKKTDKKSVKLKVTAKPRAQFPKFD